MARRRHPTPGSRGPLDRHRGATDNELVALHLAGDPSALASLLRRYRRLRQDGIRRVTGWDEDQAEQLWSDVTLRVLRGIERFDTSQPVSNWLNTIISNVLRNELRRLSRCRLVYTSGAEDPVAWGPHHPIDVPSFNRPPDEDAYIGELGRALALELAVLPEPVKATVWLGLGEGWLLADLSLVLGVEKRIAKNWRRRGVWALAPRLRSRLGLAVDAASR